MSILRVHTKNSKQKPRSRAAVLDKLAQSFPALFADSTAEGEAEADNFVSGLTAAIEHRPAELRHLFLSLLSTRGAK